MKIPKMTSSPLVILGVAAAAFLLSGCRTARDSRSSAEATNTAEALVAEKGGAQLWGDNCNRCHNIRSPGSYSDAHWDVAIHHMRVRANLTAEESEGILEFLNSAN